MSHVEGEGSFFTGSPEPEWDGGEAWEARDSPRDPGLPRRLMSWVHLAQEPGRRPRQPWGGEGGAGGGTANRSEGWGRVKQLWEEGGQIPAGCCIPAPSPGPRSPPPFLTSSPPHLLRRCGEAASCTTVTAAPASTGRVPRSCCWRCCCCWAATGASRRAGELPPSSEPPHPCLRSSMSAPPPTRVVRNPQSLGWLLSAPEPDTLSRRGRGGAPLSLLEPPSLLPASHGAELVSASALCLLLLLNLILIGRQDRLKRREVERRLRGIIDQIQGEAQGQACQA